MTTVAFALIDVNIDNALDVLQVSMPLESTCHGHTAHGNASLGWRYQRPHVSLIYENLMNMGIIGPYCILSPRRYNARNSA